jgi:quercetin dioxygenase-like cupin family protein
MPVRRKAGRRSGLAGKPSALAGLVAYQAGAVVSREIARRPSGTVTLFAFDRGQGLSEHTAPYDALILMVEGEAAFRLGAKRFRAKAGDLVILPAGRPHALHAPQRFKMLLVMIRS